MINFAGTTEINITNSAGTSATLSVKDILRSPLPEIKPLFGEGPGITGAYDFGAYLGKRIIKVLFQITGAAQLSDIQLIADKMAAWLFKPSIQSLSFDDDPNIMYYARALNTGDLKQTLFKYGECEVTFVCPDPYKYNSQESQFSTSAGAFGTHTVNGNAGALPVFTLTFTAAVTNFTLTHTPISKSIIVNKQFVNNDVLVIDCSKKKITLNGVNAMLYLDWINSEFFEYFSGSNYITMSTASVNGQVNYRERSF